ncbi:MAG: sensor domain-containing diguanylate cyclase [Desulfovibrio sp.]|nr:sensor domain-containing diguanylate cyclase [Desulfovibrio sp.]
MKDPSRDHRYFYTTLLVSLLLTLMGTWFLVERGSQVRTAELRSVFTLQKEKLASVLTKIFYKTQTLATLVIAKNGKIEGFEQVAAALLDDPCIQVMVIAPQGVVSHAYPLQGNEAVLGKDLLAHSYGSQEAIKTRHSSNIVMAGPIPLITGGSGLVGRLSVYIKDQNGARQFWGLVSIALHFPEVLKDAEMELLDDLGLHYQIWRTNPDNGARQLIAVGTTPEEKGAPYLEMPMQILNAQWVFKLSEKWAWYQRTETWLYVSCSLLFSLLFAMLVQRSHDITLAHKRLEEIVYFDYLTGIFNRRGLFKNLSTRIKNDPDKKFSLYYLDLNNFKPINDNYGHKAGDLVLQHVAAIMSKYAPKPHTFARIGGDEFVLILPEEIDAAQAQDALENTRQALSKGLPDEGIFDPITFSTGVAVYPDDGSDLDGLFVRADQAMYRDKSSHGSIRRPPRN